MNRELVISINWPLILFFILLWSYGFHGAMASESSVFEFGFSFYLIIVGFFFLFLGLRKKENFTLHYPFLIKDLSILIFILLVWFSITFDRLFEPISGDQFFYSDFSKIHESYIVKTLSKFIDFGNITFQKAMYWLDLMILFSIISIIYIKRFFRFPFFVISLIGCSSIVLTRLIIVNFGGGSNPHPPFQLFPLWLTSSLIGASDFSFRIAQLFGLIFCSFAMYLVFLKEFGRINGLFIATSLCSVPLLIYVATQVEGSIWSSITFIIILIHLISMNNRPFIYWFSFGTVISIAILMRITAFIVIPIFIILFLKYNWTTIKVDKKTLFYVLSPFLISMPFLLDSIIFGTPATSGTLEIGVLSKGILLINQLWLAISSGVFFTSTINIIGGGWLLMLIGIFLRHKSEKYYLFNRILVCIFLFFALFLLFSLKQTLWGFDKYRIEFLIPFMIFGGYLLFSKLQELTENFFVIPIISCFIIFIGINGFKNYTDNTNRSIDLYELQSEAIYDYKSALVAAKEAGLANNTLFVGVVYGMMPQILSDYSVQEVMSSMQLCKDGIICGNSKTTSSDINKQGEIKLVLISDLVKHSGVFNSHYKLREELLDLGWSDWKQFPFQERYVVYGVIRSR